MTFFYVTKEEVAAHAQEQEDRFAFAKKVAGTRSHHSYVPLKWENKLLVQRVSGDDEPSFEAAIYNQESIRASNVVVCIRQCEIGSYIACTYDEK